MVQYLTEMSEFDTLKAASTLLVVDFTASW